VAGIISGLGNNDRGVIGAAPFPAVRILPVRIFNDQGTDARMSDLITAINWALGEHIESGVPINPHPASIINLSLGRSSPSSDILNGVLAKAVQRNVLVVAAAGNIDPRTTVPVGVLTPANSPHALAVGSVDWDYRRSVFSEYGGAPIGLMAPGGSGPSSCLGIVSTIPEGRYGCMQGTSMAAPFVAAVAALVLSREPGLSVTELRARLEGATYNAAFMNEEQYGSGVLCAERVLTNSRPAPDQPCRRN
jgi:serine protease